MGQSESRPPTSGQTWRVADFIGQSVKFRTMIGTFGVAPGEAPFLPGLSLHYWYLPPDAVDTQQPHQEDEAYFVLDGRGTLTIDGRRHTLSSGDLIFVPRRAQHTFSDFDTV